MMRGPKLFCRDKFFRDIILGSRNTVKNLIVDLQRQKPEIEN